MKKAIIILTIIVLLLSINKKEQIIIPEESIRFRIVANSNSLKDQTLKKEIVNQLSTTIKEIESQETIEETRQIIKKELPKFEKIVDKTIKNQKENRNFHISYGKNYFPEKEYNNIKYEEGEYESLVITLGEGKGDNFWCVLFPPLCFIEEEKEQNEYKSFIKEIIDKYF